MKFLKSLFKKKQPVSAVNQPSVNTIVSAENSDDMFNRTFGAALSCAAAMQGITLSSEQLTLLLDTVRRVVNEGTAPADAPKSLPQAKETGNKSGFRAQFEKFDALMKLRYALRINTLLGCTEIAERKEVESEQVYHAITDYDTGTIVQDIQCAGINLWKCDVDRYMNSDKVPSYHPFFQYFDRLPKWDGKDRVSELAERVSTNSAWVRGFHRWMLGMSAQWMGYARRKNGICNARANSVAPILISTQQGWGKSTFCRMLMPEELQPFYTDSFDVAQPTASEVKLTEFGLINLDEFDRIPSTRNAQLKNLMQMSALHVRKAYQKNTKNRFRLASFIGTSNSRDLLSDVSGSRRFLCVELEHPIDCDTPIEYRQLYAQLKEEVIAGNRYWFSEEEEAEIQQNNQTYYKSSPAEELFHRVFREVDPHSEGALCLKSLEIFTELKTKYPVETAGMNSQKFACLLPGFATRVHTNKGNGYYVVRR